MANIKSFPNNQDEYVGAEYFMKWLHGRTSGVFATGKNAAVSPVVGRMAVEVSDGIGWMSNDEGNGIAWWIDNEKMNGSKTVLEIDMADSTLSRTDRVVVTWQTTNYVALPTISILKGIPSSIPYAPALTNNNSKRQISLAKIKVPAGATAISASMITDERLNEEVCGLVAEGIKIPTDMMDAQFNELLKAVEDELARIVGGTGFDPAPIRIHNKNIPGSAFSTFAGDTEENKLKAMGYEYRAAVAVPGVLENMTPYVTISLPDVGEAGIGIANQFKCYNGGVYIYSDGIPDKAITALTIECRKAVQ